MTTIVTQIVIGLCIGIVVTMILYRIISSIRGKSAASVASDILDKTKKEVATIKKEAELKIKEDEYKSKLDLEKESEKRRKELSSLESRLIHREENLDKKIDLIDNKEKEFERKEQSLRDKQKAQQEREEKYKELLTEAQKSLEKVSRMTADEAKKMLMKSMEEAARHESAKKIRRIEEETRELADKRSRFILGVAVERMAGGFAADKTVTVVNLPNDDMKGRIIGREGRNIRTLEHLTGIDLIIDDTPEAVVLSGFDPIRREIARLSLEKLIVDGRIHPARIEEVVKASTKEVNQTIREAGEQATFDIGIHGIHPELIKLLGSLKFRTSYSQNQLAHSCEVGFLAGMMASELGENVKIAKRAGLLHDIGKAVTHEVEGSHALIGMEMAKKYGEQELICHAIGSHHEEIQQDNVLDFIVDAADTLSGARPGARVEALESYTKRLEDLEQIATSFEGVESTYAIQAGREIRVMVRSDQVNDDEAVLLSKDIAKKIEEELTYPGTIRVTVIRETRAVEVAK